MKKSIMPLTVGALVACLVLIDYYLAPVFYKGGNFVWVAFASWTVFFGAKTKERFAVIPSYIIGFLSANLMIWLSGCLDINNIMISAGAAFLVNALIMYLADIKFLSIAGIFVGIFITFSGAGVSMPMWSLNMPLLILAYGVLGLTCGWVCSLMQERYINEKQV